MIEREGSGQPPGRRCPWTNNQGKCKPTSGSPRQARHEPYLQQNGPVLHEEFLHKKICATAVRESTSELLVTLLSRTVGDLFYRSSKSIFFIFANKMNAFVL